MAKPKRRLGSEEQYNGSNKQHNCHTRHNPRLWRHRNNLKRYRCKKEQGQNSTVKTKEPYPPSITQGQYHTQGHGKKNQQVACQYSQHSTSKVYNIICHPQPRKRRKGYIRPPKRFDDLDCCRLLHRIQPSILQTRSISLRSGLPESGRNQTSIRAAYGLPQSPS